MAKRIQDPGTGTKNTSARLINKNGTFNVKRMGVLHPVYDLYHYLVNVSWFKFFVLVFICYTIVNTIFAFIYLACGVEQFNGITKTNFLTDFLNCFFFSAQSLTTVGYGNISPNSHLTQMVATFEALIGVMNFALITGILYGRFSKPVARIVYSNNAIIAPYENAKGIMIRIANLRNNALIKPKASLLYSRIEKRNDGQMMRDYYSMPLEVDSIGSMPLSWTIVHPVDDKSPFWQKTIAQIMAENGEIMVQIQAFDETFHATVYSRHSYTASEIIDNAKFEKAFDDIDGNTVLDLRKISAYKNLN